MSQRTSKQPGLKPDSAPHNRSRAGFTSPQRLALALLALLILTWLFIGVLYFSDYNHSYAPPPPTTTQPESTTTSTIVIPTPTRSTPTANPVPVACAQSDAEILQGSLQVAKDGNLIILSTSGKESVIRLAGVQLPANPAVWEKTQTMLQSLAHGQSAVIALIDEERQNGYLFVDGVFINYELVRQGLASVDLQYPALACMNLFNDAQLSAREEKLGVWQPTPVPTSTFVPTVVLDPFMQPNCDCSIPYVCSDFSTHDEAQACYNACIDYDSKLDPDHNGLACEDLP